MKYQQIKPPEYLAQYIRYFWTLDSDDPEAADYTFRTIADGGPGLLFQHPDKGVYYQDGKLLPGIFLYGQSTTHASIRLMGRFRTVGVLFYPNALRSVFGLDAGILTDLCLDLDQLGREHGFYLSEQLCSALSAEEQVRCLSEYLFFLVRRNSAHADPVMEHALRQMMQSKGNIALKELQDKLCLSERSVERRFRQYVGLSPKLFARICRFQASLNQLRHSQYEKLSDIAYENDYADQSHLIRSFKEFAGVAPNNFQRQSSLLETPLRHTLTAEDPLVGFVLFYGLQRS